MRVCEFGEERVLRPIFDGLEIERGFFVDIGAGGPYSNTDWLAKRDWRGVQVDGNAQSLCGPLVGVTRMGGVMIYATDVAPLLAQYAGFGFDFLSIDVDGMDYWLLKAAFDLGHRPRVVCIEFNQSKVAVDDIQPYEQGFVWPGGTTFGCSWRALNELAEGHGYILAFKNLVNCIFVINDARTLGAMFPRSQG
jgi:hypothetical protein